MYHTDDTIVVPGHPRARGTRWQVVKVPKKKLKRVGRARGKRLSLKDCVCRLAAMLHWGIWIAVFIGFAMEVARAEERAFDRDMARWFVEFNQRLEEHNRWIDQELAALREEEANRDRLYKDLRKRQARDGADKTIWLHEPTGDGGTAFQRWLELNPKEATETGATWVDWRE